MSTFASINGYVHGHTLVDLNTGTKKSFSEIISGGGGGTVTWGDITGKPTTFPPVAATATVAGGVKMAATQAPSTATEVADLVTNFNELLTKLKAAGIMA